ncbi:hypothetical protein SAMN05216404_1243 [Nitrosospira multiformis]|jgi:hypothetical protein|uniref:Uncharacterized protein n=1 Tax=Nitrosospira multiformis TaxID=1231 RepID=A0A1H8PXU7_9PROT|nr:hypothetical protein [Nitrosospira multiformis]SEO46373.1 hypothetical protein SAMN05216404_1243 [Nitrosospira multiformis]
MSKKPAFDMSSLLAEKGQGAPAEDAPSRPIIKEARQKEVINRRISENTKIASSEFVNLGFKVPREFRHRLRKIAAAQDVTLVEVLREAISLYEKHHTSEI